MIPYPKALDPIFSKLLCLGARPYIIGGYIRDTLLKKESKDIDIEVYGVESYEQLQNILQEFGKVSTVGKSFGVCKLFLKNLDLDFSLPRTEKQNGHGHKAFDINIDPSLDLINASKRRDFTINAIAYDIKEKKIVDPFGGREDLANKSLRVINEKTFIEDPLRVMRAVQFSARFDLKIDPKLFELCQDMIQKNMVTHLPKERIYEEFKKLLLKAKKPSKGFLLLRELSSFSSFALLKEVSSQQYTIMLEQIDLLASQTKLESSLKIKYYFALISLSLSDTEETFTFLTILTDEKKLNEDLQELLALHKEFKEQLKQEPLDQNIRLFASKTVIEELLFFEQIVFAKDHQSLEKILAFKIQAESLGLYQKQLFPLIKGKDLISLGLKPSKEFRSYLQKVFKAQIRGDFFTREEALLWIEKNAHTLFTSSQ